MGSDYDPDADRLDLNFDDRLTVYPPGAQGNVAPVATIEGRETGLGDPHGLALDLDGKIYVTNQRFIGDPDHQSVTVYGAGAKGDAAPIATIQGKQTTLSNPDGITVTSKGEILVASGPHSGPGVIAAFAPNSTGDVEPRTTITDGVDTGLDAPAGIALDSDGQIYVTNINQVAVYAAGVERNAPPLFTIGGPKTKLLRPWGIAVDSRKNIYVADPNVGTQGSVLVYPAGSRGDVSPSAILRAPTPAAVAIDNRGDIYVKCLRGGPDHQGSIEVYPAGSRDGARPIVTIHGAISGPPYSSGLALDSTGRIYVAPSAGGVNVYPPLSSLVRQPGYPEVRPLATIGGRRSGLVYPRRALQRWAPADWLRQPCGFSAIRRQDR